MEPETDAPEGAAPEPQCEDCQQKLRLFVVTGAIAGVIIGLGLAQLLFSPSR
jgi:hypothetical protein